MCVYVCVLCVVCCVCVSVCAQAGGVTVCGVRCALFWRERACCVHVGWSTRNYLRAFACSHLPPGPPDHRIRPSLLCVRACGNCHELHVSYFQRSELMLTTRWFLAEGECCMV